MKNITHYFGDMVVANGDIWFVNDSMNALFRSNIKTLKPEFVLSFPNETTVKKRLYQYLISSNDKIICCPNAAKEIAIYDIILGSTKKIKVDFDRYSWDTAEIYGGCAVGDYVYLFRRGYSSLYQLDTVSGELNMLDIIENETNLEVGDYFWHWKIQQFANKERIMLYDNIHCILYQYDIKTMETKKLFCFTSNHKLVDFVFDNHFIWALCNDRIIYKLDGSQILGKYHCGTDTADNFYLYYCSDVLYVIDADTGRNILALEKNDTGEKKVMLPVNNTEVVCAHMYENKILIQWKDGFFYYYNGVDEISGLLESNLEDIPVEAYFPNDIIHENSEYSLNKLVELVSLSPFYQISSATSESGKMIYYNVVMKS